VSTAAAAQSAFVAVMVGALVFYLWSARQAWFSFDEWDFLSGRSAGSVASLLRPHNEHWSTLPILLWRALFHVFGIGSYVPYLLALLVAHLTLAVLLRVVILRAGVRPWTATAAASLFVLLGAGADDILWAFQIGFVGALAFGFGQLLIAGHDGPIGRRDVVALMAGLAALLCSGVGVTMVVVVGIATWSRRGWRPAVFQTAPLAGIYLLWWSTYGRKGYHEATRVGDIPAFAWSMVSATFRGLAQVPFLGIGFGVLLAAGLYLAWRGLSRADLRQRAAEPAALLAGGIVFIVITGLGRAGTIDTPSAPSRYVYVVAALILPSLALAIDTIGRRLGTWGMVLPVVLLLGIPGNVRLAADRDRQFAGAYQELRLLMLSAAHLPISAHLPADYIPAQLFTGPTTVGWLRANASAGRVPSPGPMSPRKQADVTQQLLLQPTTPFFVPRGCRKVTTSTVVTSAPNGMVLASSGAGATVTYLPDSGPLPASVVIGPHAHSPGVRFVLGKLKFDVRPNPGGQVLVCS
jgi:hypothetical protein